MDDGRSQEAFPQWFVRGSSRGMALSDVHEYTAEEGSTVTSRLTREIISRMHSGVGGKEWYLARNEFADLLRNESPEAVLELAHELWDSDDNVVMWAAVHLLHLHEAAMMSIGLSDLEAMGSTVDSWGDVDTFCSISSTLWLLRRLPERTLRRWARSESRWWRRSALVTLVAKPPKRTRFRRELIKVRGGHLDPARILPICDMLAADRDDMVVKALSWVLRDLSVPHPEAVWAFLDEREGSLAARVLREVRNKLETGLKNPRGGAAAWRRRSE